MYGATDFACLSRICSNYLPAAAIWGSIPIAEILAAAGTNLTLLTVAAYHDGVRIILGKMWHNPLNAHRLCDVWPPALLWLFARSKPSIVGLRP